MVTTSLKKGIEAQETSEGLNPVNIKKSLNISSGAFNLQFFDKMPVQFRLFAVMFMIMVLTVTTTIGGSRILNQGDSEGLKRDLKKFGMLMFKNEYRNNPEFQKDPLYKRFVEALRLFDLGYINDPAESAKSQKVFEELNAIFLSQNAGNGENLLQDQLNGLDNVGTEFAISHARYLSILNYDEVANLVLSNLGYLSQNVNHDPELREAAGNMLNTIQQNPELFRALVPYLHKSIVNNPVNPDNNQDFMVNQNLPNDLREYIFAGDTKHLLDAFEGLSQLNLSASDMSDFLDRVTAFKNLNPDLTFEEALTVQMLSDNLNAKGFVEKGLLSLDPNRKPVFSDQVRNSPTKESLFDISNHEVLVRVQSFAMKKNITLTEAAVLFNAFLNPDTFDLLDNIAKDNNTTISAVIDNLRNRDSLNQLLQEDITLVSNLQVQGDLSNPNQTSDESDLDNAEKVAELIDGYKSDLRFVNISEQDLGHHLALVEHLRQRDSWAESGPLFANFNTTDMLLYLLQLRNMMRANSVSLSTYTLDEIYDLYYLYYTSGGPLPVTPFEGSSIYDSNEFSIMINGLVSALREYDMENIDGLIRWDLFRTILRVVSSLDQAEMSQAIKVFNYQAGMLDMDLGQYLGMIWVYTSEIDLRFLYRYMITSPDLVVKLFQDIMKTSDVEEQRRLYKEFYESFQREQGPGHKDSPTSPQQNAPVYHSA